MALLKNRLQVFIIGIAIFSMFFGGGNLTFPLWIGIETSSPLLSTIGFLITGVLLPFFGVAISLAFKGDYDSCLGVWGKRVGQLLIFFLLLFWIPLGSAPRCNQLAYGAFCQMGWGTIPLWLHSAIYSVLVFALTVRKNRILEILGNVITPVLIFALIFLFISIFTQPTSIGVEHSTSGFGEFYTSFVAGYNTMDFIAAIFFSTAIIALVKEKQKEQFKLSFVRNACVIAVSLLSIVYIGMISVGYINSETLALVPRDQLLAAVGKVMFDDRFQIVIFIIITLSVLSTSIALALVFSDYMRKTLFKGRISHKVSLAISLFICYALSIVGFERLAVLIEYAMSVLYPCLLVITLYAFTKKRLQVSREKQLTI